MKSFGILVFLSIAIAGCGGAGVLPADLKSIEFTLKATTPRLAPCWNFDDAEDDRSVRDLPITIPGARKHPNRWAYWHNGYIGNQRLISVKRYSDGTAKLSLLGRKGHRGSRPVDAKTRCRGAAAR